MSLRAHLLVQLENDLQTMCPRKTRKLVHGFHSVLTHTIRCVPPRQLHGKWWRARKVHQPFTCSGENPSKLLYIDQKHWTGSLEYHYMPFPLPRIKSALGGKAQILGNCGGMMRILWMKWTDRFPKIAVELKMGRGKQKTKELSLYTGIIQ